MRRRAPTTGSASGSRSSAPASFAEGTHVPNLAKLDADFELRAVMSRTGSTAKGVATRNEAAYATTDLDQVLGDPEIDLVLISTRHDLHAPLALRALRAGKHVFVEKPLALTAEELDEIESFYAEPADAPLLMTGFNRRFSPAVQKLREQLAGRTAPIVADYRMNAGYIPLDHWVHGPEGGGRNIGEACHVYDVFDSLTGAAREGRPRERDRALGAARRQRQLHRDDHLRRRLALHAHLHGARAKGAPEGAPRGLRGRRRPHARRLSLIVGERAQGAAVVVDARSTRVTGRSSRRSPMPVARRAVADLAEEQLRATRISFDVERAISADT